MLTSSVNVAEQGELLSEAVTRMVEAGDPQSIV